MSASGHRRQLEVLRLLFVVTAVEATDPGHGQRRSMLGAAGPQYPNAVHTRERSIGAKTHGARTAATKPQRRFLRVEAESLAETGVSPRSWAESGWSAASSRTAATPNSWSVSGTSPEAMLNDQWQLYEQRSPVPRTPLGRARKAATWQYSPLAVGLPSQEPPPGIGAPMQPRLESQAQWQAAVGPAAPQDQATTWPWEGADLEQEVLMSPPTATTAALSGLPALRTPPLQTASLQETLPMEWVPRPHKHHALTAPAALGGRPSATSAVPPPGNRAGPAPMNEAFVPTTTGPSPPAAASMQGFQMPGAPSSPFMAPKADDAALALPVGLPGPNVAWSGPFFAPLAPEQSERAFTRIAERPASRSPQMSPYMKGPQISAIAEPPVSPIVLSKGDCFAGRDMTVIADASKCQYASDVLGATHSYRGLGSWPWMPRGCIQTLHDGFNVVKFNSNEITNASCSLDYSCICDKTIHAYSVISNGACSDWPGRFTITNADDCRAAAFKLGVSWRGSGAHALLARGCNTNSLSGVHFNGNKASSKPCGAGDFECICSNTRVVLLPGESVWPRQNTIVASDLFTSEEFEVSFSLLPFLTVATWGSILRVSSQDRDNHQFGDMMPAFFFHPGSTRLRAVMGRPDQHDVRCDGPVEGMPLGRPSQVMARLLGTTFAVYVDGFPICVASGYARKYSSQLKAFVFVGDDSTAPAAVTITNLLYTGSIKAAVGNDGSPPIVGRLGLDVEQAADFVNTVAAWGAIGRALADASGVARDIVDARLDAPDANTVRVDYTIRSLDAETASNVAHSIHKWSLPNLTLTINSELLTSDVDAKVRVISSMAKEPSTTNATTTQPPPPATTTANLSTSTTVSSTAMASTTTSVTSTTKSTTSAFTTTSTTSTTTSTSTATTSRTSSTTITTSSQSTTSTSTTRTVPATPAAEGGYEALNVPVPATPAAEGGYEALNVPAWIESNPPSPSATQVLSWVGPA